MKQVTFRGTGQLNGPIIINKTIELDDRTASTLTGLKRDEVKLAILAIHFPGVRIKPNQIVCDIEAIRLPKTTKVQKNEYEKKTNYSKQKSSFSLLSIILWLLFFPFKLAWWLLKKTWNEKHV
ncbi:hypothetical protein [Flavobacterium glaciei]|uniref:Uncharacterized protein n=1 Tax=Flavobacterium glaciei TaxID=386300 RepID=A0A562PSD4_9FLAO|nr:hypothetical protein [Flavobacterium glaciei]RDI53760.1 hypothetical protein DFR66_108110 [Flavobacterium glaciei]TWI46986.1 hypothetical protein IQ02_01820 [Flavobacterium glaciei]